jgi:tetratricopeptide (TPR) repeat protein
MYVNVAVLKETQPHERRVALVPSVVPKLIKLGAKLHMQTGAGEAIQLSDAAFKDVVFSADRNTMVSEADVVLAVQAPALEVINSMKEGAILVSFIYAHLQPALVKRLMENKITCFAMERVPRITRAQAMDALSSQSALAGYYAVQLGATRLARILPKITTAAGAIGPAKVLVMGLGVAGLEAIATARRLGAVVEGYAEVATPVDHGAEMQNAIGRLADKLRRNPDDAQGWALLGRTYKATQRYPEAHDAFKHALEAAPGNSGLEREYAAAETPDDDKPMEAEQAQPQQCPMPGFDAAGDAVSTASACNETSALANHLTPITVNVSLAANLKTKVLPGEDEPRASVRSPWLPFGNFRILFSQLKEHDNEKDIFATCGNRQCAENHPVFSRVRLGN